MPPGDRWLTLSRAALLASLALAWLNFFLTARWADVPGALHGPKAPFFVAALAAATILAIVSRRLTPVAFGRESIVAAIAGLATIGVCFFIWFPPHTWTEIPFSDNWPARLQSTLDQLALLRHGTLVGWQWNYLGGYPLSTDLTVTLTIPALLPMLVFGGRVGFHLAHLLLFLSLPLLVWWDLRIEVRTSKFELRSFLSALPWLAAALTAVTTLGYSYVMLRSGDTNSVAGVAATLLALVGSHATADRRKWGALVFVGGLTLIIYSHAGFLVYATMLLAVESLCYLDWRRLVRAIVATAAASLAGLPLTWEAWRYPHYFIYNNVQFDTTQPWNWIGIARKVAYNVQILGEPGRWLNDYTGLACVWLPVIVAMAWIARRTRAGFYAAAVLAVLAMTRFNVPEVGYAFVRPFHLLAVLVAPVLAAFILRTARTRALAWALVAVAAIYVQVLVAPVPHVPNLEADQPALVQAIRGLDGALVLVENTFHRDMDASPDSESEPTPFRAHFQSLLATETGKRLYAGIWDGWQWSPYRGQLVAGGAWMGRAIGTWPRARFIAELRRWGIRHLLVIHEPTRRYLTAPEFARDADVGPYAHFELRDADTRSVVTSTGRGDLTEHDPLGARIALSDVHAGDRVVVRTNYYPAWTASARGTAVPLMDVDGQLAFTAPFDGTYDVTLAYPRRPWLFVVALAGFALGMIVVPRLTARP
ncbi:MAG TPA: hypothetical protein VG538_08430 [Vicinamibacterales bacterium]|nr:hypothetical protein [Vicinamibacterales bacterium]